MVDKAIELFAEKKARCMKLNVASAFHSDMMKSASEQFLEKAKGFTFTQAKVDFYSNVLGKKLDDFSDMPEILAKHIGKSEREVAKATSYDHFFSAEESVKFGLADKIVNFNAVMGG